MCQNEKLNKSLTLKFLFHVLSFTYGWVIQIARHFYTGEEG